MEIAKNYINLYLHKISTQNALWQRYISSQLFLGVNRKSMCALLACVIVKVGVEYGY